MILSRSVALSLSLNSESTSPFQRRPVTTRCWNFISNFRLAAVDGKSWTTMPQYFKKQGFLTLGSGKLWHDGPPGQPKDNDFPFSWSDPVWGNGAPIGDAVRQ